MLIQIFLKHFLISGIQNQIFFIQNTWWVNINSHVSDAMYESRYSLLWCYIILPNQNFDRKIVHNSGHCEKPTLWAFLARACPYLFKGKRILKEGRQLLQGPRCGQTHSEGWYRGFPKVTRISPWFPSFKEQCCSLLIELYSSDTFLGWGSTWGWYSEVV